MKKLMVILLSFQLLLLSSVSVMAQEGEPAAGSDDDLLKSTQNDVFVVAGAGAAGALLGLSTLSFVDKPSEHLSNIWTGAAIGVIAGVIFVAYNSAQKGTEELQSSNPTFDTSDRVAWHARNSANLTLPSVQFGTQFWQMSF